MRELWDGEKQVAADKETYFRGTIVLYLGAARHVFADLIAHEPHTWSIRSAYGIGSGALAHLQLCRYRELKIDLLSIIDKGIWVV